MAVGRYLRHVGELARCRLYSIWSNVLTKKVGIRKTKVENISAASFHSIERFLEKLQIRSVAGLFATALNPFFLERIFGRTIALIKHAEDAGEWELR